MYGNGHDALEWTNFSIVLLAAADLIPTLLGCGALILAGRLARIIEADPFGEETVPLAEKLRRDCRRIAGASVLIYAGGNLFQSGQQRGGYAPHRRQGDKFSTVDAGDVGDQGGVDQKIIDRQ